MDEEAKAIMASLMEECEDLLTDLSGIFPPGYRFTLVARHEKDLPEADIVISSDDPDRAIAAIDRSKNIMEA